MLTMQRLEDEANPIAILLISLFHSPIDVVVLRSPTFCSATSPSRIYFQIIPSNGILYSVIGILYSVDELVIGWCSRGDTIPVHVNLVIGWCSLATPHERR